MLKLIAVLFAVIKGKCDYDDIVDDSGLTVREVIETLEKFPRYFKFDWATEFIRAADEGQDVAKSHPTICVFPFCNSAFSMMSQHQKALKTAQKRL